MTKPRSRRHKQINVLSEKPQLENGQKVVRVLQSCGENIYEVENENEAKELYALPKRLRHVVFIRRGSFVFVREDVTRVTGKVRGDIEAVVLDCFLSSLQRESYWPRTFAAMRSNDRAGSTDAVHGGSAPEDGSCSDHGEQVSDDNDWDIGEGNPNRCKWDHVSSDESESSGEE